MTHSADHYKEFETVLRFEGGRGAELPCFIVVDDRTGDVIEFNWVWRDMIPVTVLQRDLLFDVLMTGLDRQKLNGWLAEAKEEEET